jgi:hypothetical protein
VGFLFLHPLNHYLLIVSASLRYVISINPSSTPHPSDTQ